MGCCSKIVKASSVLVGLAAVLIGLLISGVPGQLGLYKFMDQFETNGSKRFTGDSPLFHQDTPWGFQHDTIADGALKGKVYLVTGANVGLGYWTAHFLAKKGGRVVLACRSDKKCADAVAKIQADLPNAGPLETRTLDLASLQSIKSFGEGFIADYPQLDSVILNAGLGMAPHSLTADGIERVMAVNHFGHFYLTQLLLPLLEATGKPSPAAPATVVSVSSSAHFFLDQRGVDRMGSLESINAEEGTDMPQYAMSKAANVLFAQELASRLHARQANVVVNAAHPGLVDTEFTRHSIEIIRSTLPKSLADIVEGMIRSLFDGVSWKPKDAALTQVACAVAPGLLNERTSGKYFQPIFRQVVPSTLVRNEKLQQDFWALSEKVIAEKTTDLK